MALIADSGGAMLPSGQAPEGRRRAAAPLGLRLAVLLRHVTFS